MMLDEVLHHNGHTGTASLFSVDRSIDCLKEVLEMMLELHVHTEVIMIVINIVSFIYTPPFLLSLPPFLPSLPPLPPSPSSPSLQMIAHFFASVFFFLNAALFNTFIDQGHEMGLFQYSRGTKVRGRK